MNTKRFQAAMMRAQSKLQLVVVVAITGPIVAVYGYIERQLTRSIVSEERRENKVWIWHVDF